MKQIIYISVNYGTSNHRITKGAKPVKMIQRHDQYDIYFESSVDEIESEYVNIIVQDYWEQYSGELLDVFYEYDRAYAIVLERET